MKTPRRWCAPALAIALTLSGMPVRLESVQAQSAFDDLFAPPGGAPTLEPLPPLSPLEIARLAAGDGPRSGTSSLGDSLSPGGASASQAPRLCGIGAGAAAIEGHSVGGGQMIGPVGVDDLGGNAPGCAAPTGAQAVFGPPMTGALLAPPPVIPGFMRSLGRYGPVPAAMPGVQSSHSLIWDSMPPSPPPAGAVAPPIPQVHDPCSDEAPFTSIDFAPDPQLDSYCWDGQTELGVYGGKHLNRTQYPWIEGFTPLYANGPWPPSFTFMGPTNLVRPKLYLYGDFRTAVANNNNAGNSQGIWANRLNLDLDFPITATERFHMFFGPLDQGQNFTSVVVDESQMEVEDNFDGWDQNTDTMYFEGDLGYLIGGAQGTDPPFDLPFTAGLIPMVLQNGIWLEDAFLGAAATIPAKNSPGLDISNYDVTFFTGFKELTTDAFAVDADDAHFYGVTTFIERRGGYFELGGAYVDDPANLGLDYFNLGASYTRRYANLLSNSVRVIVNAGQDVPKDQRTADGVLLLMENSFLTPLPYNVIPYANFFAGFDHPQPLGRLQGPLKNTGINFESDLLTGYPFLDDSGNDTYGGAFGLDLLGGQFDRQFIVETAVLQAFGDPVGRIAPGDQYALGARYQVRLGNSWILRADAMLGWLENTNDIDGARVELRHKF